MEGRSSRGFFALLVWGGLYLEGLIYEGAYFRNFTVADCGLHGSSYIKMLFLEIMHSMCNLQISQFHVYASD